MINGKTLLEIQLERLRRSERLHTVIIAITGSPADDPIAALCRGLNLPCFRGSENDVLERYNQAAHLFDLETIVRLTSDCPLIDPELVDQVVGAFLEAGGGYDFAANTVPLPATFPDGLDVEVFSRRALELAWREARKPSEREHVTFFFWKQPQRFRLLKIDAPKDYSHLRLTVDYPDDLPRVAEILSHFERTGQRGSLADIVAFSAEHPQLFNQHKHQAGEGWMPSLLRDADGTGTPQKAPALAYPKTDEAWETACDVVPTGAQTFSKTPGQFVEGVAPKMVVRGRGSKVWDLDGHEFIDYTLGLGPAILGHSRPEVDQAAFDCARDYLITPPLAHPLETRLANRLREFIPSAEMVKYGKNGSDVTAGAVRLARAYSGRDIVACCGYHGWQDWYIGSTSRRLGVPKSVQALTKTFEYNNMESLQQIFNDHPDNVAAVILEPVTFVAPTDQFLHKVRELCDRHRAVLIFDEVVTGFRLDLRGAQGFFGVTPDLSTFGKAIANGHPLSVLCGKAEIMRRLQDVFFSFTFGGELPSIAAALQTLQIVVQQDVPAHIRRLGKRFREEFNKTAQELKADWVQCIGLDFWPEYVFSPTAGFSAQELLTLLQQEVVRRGVLTRAALFISLAHSDYDLDQTLRAYHDALAFVKQAVGTGTVREHIDGRLIEPVIRAETVRSRLPIS
jgi:glutamate-1-semialdehyde aminotransferase/spore coat polysaccharide biosynthesis protein SpsF (cytidylyltransferase family)